MKYWEVLSPQSRNRASNSILGYEKLEFMDRGSLMKNFRVLMILALATAFAAGAMAQDDEEDFKWRNFEVTLTGGLSLPMGDLKDWNDSLGAKTGHNFGGSGGYYFNNRLCVGGYFEYSQFSLEEPNSNIDVSEMHYKMYKVGGYVKYALGGESYWEPFARLRAGANFAKFATWIGDNTLRLREVSYDPEVSVGLDLGLLYYTSDYGGVFVQVSYNYERLENTVGESFNEDYVLPYNANYITLNAGVTVFFGPQ